MSGFDYGPYFKGWAKPGPMPPGASDRPSLPPSEDETLDALSGHYRIYQLKKGHRYSTDDLLTAWYGTTWAPCPRAVLDLGSGIGSVGMMAAWRLQGARFVTVEAQPVSVALARRSARFNGLDGRYEIREGDFRDAGVLNESERFDLILGSPPYFPMDAGIHGDHPQKVACRFEMRGAVADYCTTASRHLELGGLFACVFPIQPQEQLLRVERGAAAAGLTILRRRPVVFKEGESPSLAVFAMCRSDHLPESFRGRTWVEPPLVIRGRDGSPHPEYSSVKLSVGLPP